MEYENKIKEIIDSLNEIEKQRLISKGFTNCAFFDDNGTMTQKYTWHLKEGKKYDKLDCGSSGYFMIEKETGEIFNIKAYGVPDKNKKVKANLGNINQCFFSDKDLIDIERIKLLSVKRYN